MSIFKGSNIEFFVEAIKKWDELTKLYYDLRPLSARARAPDKLERANLILAWFQFNYDIFRRHSDFSIYKRNADGKNYVVDNVFSIAYTGSYIENILNVGYFEEDLLEGAAQLKGHLSSVIYLGCF